MLIKLFWWTLRSIWDDVVGVPWYVKPIVLIAAILFIPFLPFVILKVWIDELCRAQKEEIPPQNGHKN